MTDPSPDTDPPEGHPRPIHGQVRHSNVSARVPKSVGSGVFSNGVLILSGQHESVLDFVLRMGEVQKVVARVILPPVVARQFAYALQENLKNYEERFGVIPALPMPVKQTEHQDSSIEETPIESSEQPWQQQESASKEQAEEGPSHPPEVSSGIDDIYHDLKLPDDMLSGRYANAVLIRHSGTEFCFDFITNVYPRSAVSCRVFVAAPHVPPLLDSLKRSLQPPESD